MKLPLAILLIAVTALGQTPVPPIPPQFDPDAIVQWKALLDEERATGYAAVVVPAVTNKVHQLNFSGVNTNGVWRTLILRSTNMLDWRIIADLPQNTDGLTVSDTNNLPVAFYQQVLAWETNAN